MPTDPRARGAGVASAWIVRVLVTAQAPERAVAYKPSRCEGLCDAGIVALRRSQARILVDVTSADILPRLTEAGQLAGACHGHRGA